MRDALAAPDFLLANAGSGPDPCSLTALSGYDFVVLAFLRGFGCANCRKQVRALADRYDAFRRRATQIVAVLPEPRERAAEWQAEYDLPFPLAADPDSTVGDAYDQPVRFGGVETTVAGGGRLPAVVALDYRDERPRFAWVHKGTSAGDRPSVDEICSKLDALAGK